jgi:stage V sporulation protein S
MADLVRVSSNSRSTSVAGAIAGIMREEGFAEVQAIGAPAVNQAIKAITIARTYLEGDQIDLAIVPSFHAVEIGGQERTAIHFAVYRRPPGL